jgi:hypothetical protein
MVRARVAGPPRGAPGLGIQRGVGGTQVAPLSDKPANAGSLSDLADGECRSVKEDQPMIRLVVFLAIGVMGLILVRVRRQRKTRTAMPTE